MTIELLFYTQIASILAYVAASFALYRLLVAKKDSTIELLEKHNGVLEAKIRALELQAPDVLTDALSRRIDSAKKEIAALSEDGDLHRAEIEQKKKDLKGLTNRLGVLQGILKENSLVCPTCFSIEASHDVRVTKMELNGQESDVFVGYSQYECGMATLGSNQVKPCPKSIES